MGSTIVLSSLAGLAATAPQPITNLEPLSKHGSRRLPRQQNLVQRRRKRKDPLRLPAIIRIPPRRNHHQQLPTYYDLQAYDPSVYQAKCDAVTGCKAFNLYFERNPTVDPDTNKYPNPPPFTNVKCSLWGTTIVSASATNVGQYRAGFQVVIAGSNGYNKLPPPPPAQPGFNGPIPLSGAIIFNALPDPSTYMGVKLQAGTSLNTTFCATECTANTAYDRAHPKSDGSYTPCNFFNAWLGLLAGVPDGTHCAEFTQPWGKPYDTNMGQYQGNAFLNVTQSFGYSLSPQDPGTVSSVSKSD